MPTYHYLNPDHTLALRDNHCIAWDPAGDRPAAIQHASTDDELKIWRDAGAPRPTLVDRRFQVPPRMPPEKLERGEKSRDMQAVADMVLLEDIEAALPSDDLTALKLHVQSLVGIVRQLLPGRLRR